MQKIKPKNRLREVRRKRGLRQSDLAKKVGIFQSEISEIEKMVKEGMSYDEAIREMIKKYREKEGTEK